MKKFIISAAILGGLSLSAFNTVHAADISASTLPSFNGGNSVDIATQTPNNINIQISDGYKNSVGAAYWDSFNIGNGGNSNVNSVLALPSFREGQNVDVTTQGSNNMNIRILGGNNSVGTAYWNSFNIGSGANVNVEFTANNQTSLNYVDKAGGMSQIYGNFTDSGYNSTGKVLLINPNGILFGKGANIDLNSFTASTLNGTYNTKTNTLVLNKTGKEISGIIVDEGAIIKGSKNVSLVSDNIITYKGSQIRTGYGNSYALNSQNHSNSIKLITSDGVTFKYSNDGNIDEESKLVSSSKKMILNLNGNIDATNIDIKNSSTNKNSQININGANIKAHKFIMGNDGSIYIAANNDINIDNSDIGMVNYDSICYADGSCMSVNFDIISDEEWYISEASLSDYPVNPEHIVQTRLYNDKATKNQSININAKNNLNIKAAKLSANYNSNDLKLTSTSGNVDINSSSIYGSGNVNIQSKKNLILNSDNISASDVKVKSLSNGVSINKSSVWAKSNNIDINSKQDLIASNNNLKSRNKINMISNSNTDVNNNYLYTNDLILNSKKSLNFNNNNVASNNTKLTSTNNNAYVNNNNIYTKKDLNVTSNKELYFANNNVLSDNITLKSTNSKANLNNNNVYTFGNFNVTNKQDLVFNNNNLSSEKNVELKSTNNKSYIDNNNIDVSGNLNIKSNKELYFNNNKVLSDNNVVLQSTNGKSYADNNELDVKNNITVKSKTGTIVYNNKVKVGNKESYTAKNKKVVKYGNY